MRRLITRRKLIGGAVASATAFPFANLTVAATGPKTHEVTIKSFVFEPMHIEVQVGDTIKWINEDLAPHTATAEEFGWDTGELAKGERGEVLVAEGMETSYFCVFHPHMKGSISIS